MKANYFYNHKLGDVLFIIINNDLIPTNYIKNGDIVVIYHQKEIIGINIFNISSICKIKTNGQIHLPPNILIDLLNNLLKGYNIQLDFIDKSLFCIGKVLSIEQNNEFNIINVDINPIVKLKIKDKINTNNYCVIACKGALLSSGIVVENYHLCSYKDLSLNDKEELIILNDRNIIIGQDFFLTQRG